MKRFLIHTMGCKSNQFEGAVIEENLIKSGFEKVKKLENADGEYALNITKVPDREGPRKDFDVDALSGATLTSNGVNNAVHYWFGDAYKPFLDNLRKGEILK